MAKIRSPHTYVIPWMFYFGGQCMKLLTQSVKIEDSNRFNSIHSITDHLCEKVYGS